jgi:chromosome segregation ATPase
MKKSCKEFTVCDIVEKIRKKCLDKKQWNQQSLQDMDAMHETQLNEVKAQNKKEQEQFENVKMKLFEAHTRIEAQTTMFSNSEKERKNLEKKNSQCTAKLENLEKELQDGIQMIKGCRA